MTDTPVARPVYAFDAPASMAQRVKVARAIKVLHGPDCREYQIGPKYVVYSAGELCPCVACDHYLRKLAGLTWRELPQRMIVCSTCGNKRCPHADSHDNTCTRSNEPGQTATLPRHPDATRHQPEHEIADDYERNEHR